MQNMSTQKLRDKLIDDGLDETALKAITSENPSDMFYKAAAYYFDESSKKRDPYLRKPNASAYEALKNKATHYLNVAVGLDDGKYLANFIESIAVNFILDIGLISVDMAKRISRCLIPTENHNGVFEQLEMIINCGNWSEKERLQLINNTLAMFSERIQRAGPYLGFLSNITRAANNFKPFKDDEDQDDLETFNALKQDKPDPKERVKFLDLFCSEMKRIVSWSLGEPWSCLAKTMVKDAKEIVANWNSDSSLNEYTKKLESLELSFIAKQKETSKEVTLEKCKDLIKTYQDNWKKSSFFSKITTSPDTNKLIEKVLEKNMSNTDRYNFLNQYVSMNSKREFCKVLKNAFEQDFFMSGTLHVAEAESFSKEESFTPKQQTFK